MASARQIAANQRNARLPRGPLSEAASASVRENPLKHGLTAKHVVLRHEDQAEYEELRASIAAEYRPATPQEHRLADQIAQNYWRLLRCRRVETAAFENHLDTLKRRLEIDPAALIDDDQGISICMSNDSRDFDSLRRYETTIERAWYRAIRELRAVQKNRRQSELAETGEVLACSEAEPAAFGSGEELADYTIKPKVSEFGIGCVLPAVSSAVRASESSAPFCTNEANRLPCPSGDGANS
jgi:hypothetical protein